MPFAAPFKSRFEPGDLVYGLGYYGRGGARHEYGQAPEFQGATETPSTIDQYAAIAPEIAGQEEGLQVKPARQDEYASFLKRHPKYGSLYGSKTANRETWQRKCKAGLQWAANSKDPGMTVHFILDDIEQREVIDKSGLRKDSVTGSELRWVYRNRHDKHVQECVQFWQNMKPVPPPWTVEYGHAYREHLSEQYGDELDDEYDEEQLEQLVTSFSELWGQYKPKRSASGAGT